MKLIDLLVQELPKRGGWPDFAEVAVQYSDSQICFSSHRGVYTNKEKTDWYGGDWGCGDWENPFVGILADDRHECVVTRNQYESAIAAPKKSAWNGEGLPPVGCECEYQYKVHGSEWCPLECVAVDGKAVFGWSNNTPVALQSTTHNFRPLRTEEQRKRDIVVKTIKELFKYSDDPSIDDATLIYNAIAAGKIPGVKLDD